MDRLTKLADKHGTDKGSVRHNYTAFYDQNFKHLRGENLCILEIGINYGYSANMWLEYFPNSSVFGLDMVIEDEDKKRDNIRKISEGDFGHRFFYKEGDQGRTEDLEYMWNWSIREYGKGFDIIIEDGSHVYDHQQLCFEYYFPRMNAGSMMVIEDLHTRRKRSTKPSTLGEIRSGSLDGWDQVISFDVFQDKTCIIRK